MGVGAGAEGGAVEVESGVVGVAVVVGSSRHPAFRREMVR